MTAQQLAYSCLEYLGEFSLTTFTEYLGTAEAAVRRALLLAINEGAQELYGLKPELFKREVGVTVNAPETGTVTVSGATVSATTLTGATTGNTLLIAGQAEYNAIRTEGAGRKLCFPYTGPAGTHAATLYGDALLLPAAYSRPLGPVWLSDIRELTPLAGKGDFLGYDPRQHFGSDWGRVPFGRSISPQPHTVGQPEAFFVDTHLLEAGASEIRIFLTPLPDRVYSLRFDAGVHPPAILAADLGTDGADPGTVFGLLPGNDRFLTPLVLRKWARSSFFKNTDAAKQIREDYAAILPEIEAWRVQPQTGAHLVTRGWR